MGWDDPNPYYNPEKFDLEVVGLLDENLSYEFNMFVVWRHQDGRLFWAEDSGCSCPTPFENHNTLESLKTGTQVELAKDTLEWTRTVWDDKGKEKIKADAHALLRKVGGLTG